MKIYIDNIGRRVQFPAKLERMISLCPSVTETLYDLGLAEKVVGRTKFCIHPSSEVKKAKIIGGTKKIDFAQIDALKPDVIWSVKEENTQEIVEELAKKHPVFVFDIDDFTSALEMIRVLGKLTETELLANQLTKNIQSQWTALKNKVEAKKCLYFIWKEPLMLASKGTYIDTVLTHLGFENLAHTLGERYPIIEEKQFADLAIETIFLSSEPYPFAEKHLDYFRKLAPAAQIQIVDGEMFSWYGTRMLLASDYFKQTLGL
ncbi:MAG: ABC transporter substrate-binding protein [Bacteroidia bacterium]